MADAQQGNPTTVYRPEMDGPSHEAAYDNFTHFTTVATAFVICVVMSLAVGGVKHAWLSSVVMVVLAIVATTVGLSSRNIAWRAPGAVIVLLLLMLILY